MADKQLLAESNGGLAYTLGTNYEAKIAQANTPDKASPVTADEILIFDSAALNVIKKADYGSFPTNAAAASNGGLSFSGNDAKIDQTNTPDKASPLGTDEVLIFDGAAGNAIKKADIDSLPIGGSPGGSDGQVQYNNGGSFGGNSHLVFNDSSSKLSVGAGGSPTAKCHVKQGSTTGACPVVTLDQDDTDQPCLRFEGYCADGGEYSSTETMIDSTVNGTGALVGPKANGGSDSFYFSYQGAINVTIGVTGGSGVPSGPFYVPFYAISGGACPRVDAFIDGKWVYVGRAIRFNKGEEKKDRVYILHSPKPTKRFRLVEDEAEISRVTIIGGDGREHWTHDSGQGEIITQGGSKSKPGTIVEFTFTKPQQSLETRGYYIPVQNKSKGGFFSWLSRRLKFSN